VRHARRGFTLIELLVVLVFIGAMLALVAPQLQSSSLAENERTTIGRLQAAIQAAQAEAVRWPGQTIQLSFEPAQVRVLKAGVAEGQFTQAFATGVTLPGTTVVTVQADGTLLTSVALALASAEYTYPTLTVDRNGQLHQ
jgi:prepilin-type N-terminal cleavage/methylation domain-containing protein